MFDLTAYVPFLVGFFTLAAIAIGASVASIVTIAQEQRATSGRVISLSAAHPKVVAATRRAA